MSLRIAQLSLLMGIIFGFVIHAIPYPWRTFAFGLWIACLFFYSHQIREAEEVSPPPDHDGSSWLFVGYLISQCVVWGWHFV